MATDHDGGLPPDDMLALLAVIGAGLALWGWWVTLTVHTLAPYLHPYPLPPAPYLLAAGVVFVFLVGWLAVTSVWGDE